MPSPGLIQKCMKFIYGLPLSDPIPQKKNNEWDSMPFNNKHLALGLLTGFVLTFITEQTIRCTFFGSAYNFAFVRNIYLLLFIVPAHEGIHKHLSGGSFAQNIHNSVHALRKFKDTYDCRSCRFDPDSFIYIPVFNPHFKTGIRIKLPVDRHRSLSIHGPPLRIKRSFRSKRHFIGSSFQAGPEPERRFIRGCQCECRKSVMGTIHSDKLGEGNSFLWESCQYSFILMRQQTGILVSEMR